MPTLYVLRHAKSDWTRGVADRERPLNERGRRAASQVGELLRARRISPDLVLCSSARRTQETLARLEPWAGREPEVSVEDELYGAGPGQLLHRLRRLGAAGPPPPVGHRVGSVLLVGHNPGVHGLVLVLAGSGSRHLLAQVREAFPTASLATITLDADWSALRDACGTLTDLVLARDLD